MVLHSCLPSPMCIQSNRKWDLTNNPQSVLHSKDNVSRNLDLSTSMLLCNKLIHGVFNMFTWTVRATQVFRNKQMISNILKPQIQKCELQSAQCCSNLNQTKVSIHHRKTGNRSLRTVAPTPNLENEQREIPIIANESTPTYNANLPHHDLQASC